MPSNPNLGGMAFVALLYLFVIHVRLWYILSDCAFVFTRTQNQVVGRVWGHMLM